MTEPQSVKNESITDFPSQAYSIIDDDFCHGKILAAKVKSKTSKSVIKLKETITNKKGTYNFADEIKLWFDLPNNRSFYAKVKSADYLKLHYDHGLREWQKKKYYLFGNLRSNKSFTDMTLKAGVGHISEHCQSDNRIRVNLQQNDSAWCFYHRTTVTHNKLTLGFVGVFDLTQKVLQKNNFLLGYKADDKTDVFLRAEVEGFRKNSANLQKPESIFDTFTLDLVRKIDERGKIGF